METVKIELSGEFAGWWIEMRKRVSARVLIDLQGEPAVQFAAFEKLTVAHNFKGIDGNAAESVLDAPVDAVAQAMTKWSESLATLPNAQG